MVLGNITVAINLAILQEFQFGEAHNTAHDRDVFAQYVIQNLHEVGKFSKRRVNLLFSFLLLPYIHNRITAPVHNL